KGLSPVLAADEMGQPPAQPVEALMWLIRRSWTLFFEKQGPVAVEDLVGILRTLLHSIKAQAWRWGPKLGYVQFIKGFMAKMGVTHESEKAKLADLRAAQAANPKALPAPAETESRVESVEAAPNPAD